MGNTCGTCLCSILLVFGQRLAWCQGWSVFNEKKFLMCPLSLSQVSADLMPIFGIHRHSTSDGPENLLDGRCLRNFWQPQFQNVQSPTELTVEACFCRRSYHNFGHNGSGNWDIRKAILRISELQRKLFKLADSLGVCSPKYMKVTTLNGLWNGRCSDFMTIVNR